jgi:hypothetical protein
MAAPISSDIYRISARGNGYTAKTTIQDYALLKAAETTLKVGATHFLIMRAANATETATVQTAGLAQTNFVVNTAYTVYTPGQTYDIVRPGEDLIIRVIGVPAGRKPPSGAFAAQEVFDAVNPRVQRPKS